jgi:3-oxoacyl-[acyl-carrier protein] reductase
MDLGLKDKAALVTGSSRGLGLASARALVIEGCRVCLCARGEEQLLHAGAELASAAGAADRITVVRVDLSTPEGGDVAVRHAVSVLGGLDIVVNNVGRAAGSDLLATTDAEWQAAFDETLYPAIRVSRAAVPHLRRRGGGAIIMIASIWGRESGGRMTYNAVKAAEISLAKALAQQLAASNIRVNSVSPGSISFEGGTWWKRQQENPAAMAEFVKREIPMGRFGRPEEVGDVVAFLASARASWISGTSVVVDGCQSRSF